MVSAVVMAVVMALRDRVPAFERLRPSVTQM
jgi:hypothetical protein